MLGKPVFTDKIIARNLGLEEAKVSSVTAFFHKELHQEIKNCEHPFLYVKGLGTFALNQNKVDKMIRNMLGKINMHKTCASREDKKHIKIIESLKQEIFELFRIRRLIKERKKENQILRDVAKSVDDNKRKPLPAPGH